MIVACRPVVNVFKEASELTEVTSQVLYGTPIALLEDLGLWLLIRTEDGYQGFAQAQDFLEVEPLPTSLPTSLPARVNQLSANLYREPDVKKSAPVLNLPWEARLEILGDFTTLDDDVRWFPVRLLDGASAYIQRGDLRFDTTPCTLAEMLALSHRFLGITYTWGGTSTYGFDCSGFVQMLFRQAGVSLPRDAQAQADWVGFTPVKRDHLKPADVLFFGDNPQEITHVGLHLGDGVFIHDTPDTQPCVQISQLGDAPWSERLCAQRRLRP